MHIYSATVLITGGAGFIGSNLAKRLLAAGNRVIVFDNLSRVGTQKNLDWLKTVKNSELLTIVKGDLLDEVLLSQTMATGIDIVFHLAGQVAVTSSVQSPRQDFLDNALGTFNVLEAVRLSEGNPIVVYASTNKVYGKMEHVRIGENETRYLYEDMPQGVPETFPLDFHSPYGCSKGAADQYVRDYARIYGLRTIVFRQSCIYGYRQLGVEDQGWLAWFAIAATQGRPITIYGDGKQVRDVLFIDDLLDAYEAAVDQIEVTSGKVYNIGGGPKNTISVWREFRPILEKKLGKEIVVSHADWRPGDQPVYVSDIGKAEQDFGWRPQVAVDEGIGRLCNWVLENPEMFKQ